MQYSHTERTTTTTTTKVLVLNQFLYSFLYECAHCLLLTVSLMIMRGYNVVMSCHVMLCHVMSCHVMSCHVMSCYVMLCFVLLCYSLIKGVESNLDEDLFKI